MAERQNRILVIGGGNLLQIQNHRIHHVVAYLIRRGLRIDAVGQVNFYTGPPAGVWTRFSQGSNSMFHKRAEVLRKGHNVQIIVRKLPGILDGLVQDLWTYFILRPLLRERYELCIFGHPLNAFLALLLKKRRIVGGLVYDDWDYFPALVRRKGPFGPPIIKWRERICVKNSDGVISVSHPLAELRRRQGAKRVIVVPNGVDYSLFQAAQNKRPHPPTLIYMGTLSRKWGVDLPIRALPAIKAKVSDIRYIVLGGGPDADALRALAYEKMKLQEHVFFLGRQEYRRLPHFLAEADIGVLTHRAGPFIDYASSLKAIEYMAAGLPIIATRVGQSEITMQQAHAGILIDGSEEEFAAAVVTLLTDKRRYGQYSQAATTYAARFDWDLLLDPAYRFVLKIIADKQVSNAMLASSELSGDTS